MISFTRSWILMTSGWRTDIWVRSCKSILYTITPCSSTAKTCCLWDGSSCRFLSNGSTSYSKWSRICLLLTLYRLPFVWIKKTANSFLPLMNRKFEFWWPRMACGEPLLTRPIIGWRHRSTVKSFRIKTGSKSWSESFLITVWVLFPK